MRRKATWIVIALVLAGAGIWLATRRKSAGPTGFTTATVKRGRIEAKVTATGTVSPIVNVTVGSQISGRVAALFADYNSQVTKGQVIAKLDTALYEAAVESARANVLQAQGNLAKARAQALDAGRQAKRSRLLLEQKLIAQADTDTSEATKLANDAAAQAGEGDLAAARAMLRQAETNLRYCTISSPINGIVISRSVDVGQTVAASMTAPTLFVIAEDLQKMQVDTNVSEADVGRIVAGMDVTFHVDAYPTQTFRGRVRQVRNAATTVQNVVTYDAVVDVENQDLKLKPGMTATLSFVYAESKEALKMPTSALRFVLSGDAASKDRVASKAPRGEGKRERPSDQRPVWVLRPGASAPEQVQVKVGISDGSFIEVVEGVREGDVIVTDSIDAAGASKSGGKRSGMPRF